MTVRKGRGDSFHLLDALAGKTLPGLPAFDLAHHRIPTFPQLLLPDEPGVQASGVPKEAVVPGD